MKVSNYTIEMKITSTMWSNFIKTLEFNQELHALGYVHKENLDNYSYMLLYLFEKTLRI